MTDCDAPEDWWTALSCTPTPEKTVFFYLVPFLLLIAAIARYELGYGAGGMWAHYLLNAGKPMADVAFVVGMVIQAQDYVTCEDARTAWTRWMLHGLLVPAFAGADLCLLWILLAVVVYSLSLGVFGAMHVANPEVNHWPYSLSPLVSLVFVASYLLQHAGDAVARALLHGTHVWSPVRKNGQYFALYDSEMQ